MPQGLASLRRHGLQAGGHRFDPGTLHRPSSAIALVKRAPGRENGCPGRRDDSMQLLLIIFGIILAVAAIVGGITLHALFWLLLIVALVVFAIGALTGRITE